MSAASEAKAQGPPPKPNRRASWSEEAHRPQHMRWRDKLAYLETNGGETRASNTHEVHVINVNMMSPEKSPDATRVQAAAPPVAKVSSARCRHMRWRDKIAYLEKQGEHPSTGGGAAPAKNRRASESSVDDKPTGRAMRATADGVEMSSTSATTRVHTYSEDFTHHPPHIRFRDKMAILRGEKPVTSFTRGHHQSEPVK